MGNTAIVAIPAKDDYVWQLSSEKVPHMTLLNLGDGLSEDQITRVMGYVEHAAAMSLRPFDLSVARRGKLGSNDADVVFFTPQSWDLEVYKSVQVFRGILLKDRQIKTAYDLTPQFEGWTPHLTLGYPDDPAKADTRDYPGVQYVRFDKLALWTGEYEGPEFELVDSRASLDLELAMSAQGGSELMHHGIKGMKWGVRRSREDRARSKEIEVKLHNDHKKARALMKKRVSHLSNEELRFINERRRLESEHAKLNPSKRSRRQKKVKDNLDTIKLAEDLFKATQGELGQKLLTAAAKKSTSPAVKKILKTVIKPVKEAVK